MLHSFLAFFFLICLYTASFKELPNELRTVVFEQLPKTDFIKSVLTFNNKTYQGFKSNHYSEIQKIKLIEAMLRFEHTQEIDRNLLRNLSKGLQLSELYALKLPSLMQIITERHLDSDDLLSAMNIQTISSAEIDTMTFDHFDFDDSSQEIQFMLKLLTLSSRSLAPFSETERGIVHWFYRTGFGAASCISARHPWIVCPLFSDIVHKTYFYYVYKYLFEKHHQMLNIPALHRIYIDDGSKERKHLIELIDQHGMIAWHEQSLKTVKRKQPALNNCLHIIKLHKIYERLFELLPQHDDARLKSKYLMLDIMTHIFQNEFQNLTCATMNACHSYNRMFQGIPDYATETITQLAFWNYQAGNYDAFERLIWINAKIGCNETKKINVQTMLDVGFDFSVLENARETAGNETIH